MLGEPKGLKQGPIVKASHQNQGKEQKAVMEQENVAHLKGALHSTQSLLIQGLNLTSTTAIKRLPVFACFSRSEDWCPAQLSF